MRTPPLTIALLTYNRRGYLKEALDAILGQTCGDFELMVLDNGSTDGTADLVLACKDPRLTYVRHPPGQGPEYNAASAQWFARGQRLLITHDDDIFEPNLVEREMAWLDADRSLLAVAANPSLINGESVQVQPVIKAFKGDQVFRRGEYLGFYLRQKFPLPISSLMVNVHMLEQRQEARKYLKSIDPDRVFWAGDVFYLCMLNALGNLGLIGEPLIRYRMHQGQTVGPMDPVKPELDLLLALQRPVRRFQVLHKHAPALRSAILRYRGQEVVLAAARLGDLAGVRRRLGQLRRQWARALPPRQRQHDVLLPLEILALLLDLEPLMAAQDAASWPATTDPCQRALRRWHQRALQGERLFRGPRLPRRIAVFGSALLAYLIVLEARRAGIEVVCCLDRNPQRLGSERVLGCPVFPHAWLEANAGQVDAIVLSTEGRQGDYQRSLIQARLGDRQVPLPSWKEFLLGRVGR